MSITEVIVICGGRSGIPLDNNSLKEYYFTSDRYFPFSVERLRKKELLQLFKNAIVRLPASNFADGLTTVNLGVPSFDAAMQQYSQYCKALLECGLQLNTLAADPRHPDSAFVEDTAVLTPKAAIFTRPGATSRAGEVDAIREAVGGFFSNTLEIEAPGTLDGGDICEADGHFFIGLSHRTNEEGARQLAAHLEGLGYTSSSIDVRGVASILHLKSGISYIGNNTMVAIEEMAGNALFRGYELIQIPQAESYSANCVRVNERVLAAAGYPHLIRELEKRGFHPFVLEMSEFQKMDGGLSCLSLRF
jgi:dimethylargininase